MERNLLRKLTFAIFVLSVSVLSLTTFSGTLVHPIISSVSQFVNLPGITSQVIANASASEKLSVPSDSLKCLAENIYYESATQSYAGKIAVGEVVLNRVKAPGFPNTVCGVIYDGAKNPHTTACQFSWLCQPHKGIDKTSFEWAQSIKVATELLTHRDSIVDITDGAISYHADYANPDWSKSMKFITQIDNHLFYKAKS
jgi:spore germination cell wall hydrolase CwlJ-like protein